MACLVSEAGVATPVPEPESGWTIVEVKKLIPSNPVVKSLATAVGEYRFLTSRDAVDVNMRATLEARVLLRGAVLVIPPTERVIRSQS